VKPRLLMLAIVLGVVAAWPSVAAAREQSDREKLDAKIEAATRAPEMIVKPAHEQKPWFIGWGLKQGLNASRFHGSMGTSMGGETIYGFGVGAYAAIRMTDGIRFVPGLSYSERGGRGEVAVPVTGGTWRFGLESKLTYVEAPMLFEFAGTRGNLRPYLIAGASFSWKVDAQRTVSDLGMTPAPPGAIRYAQIFENVGTLDGDSDYLEDFDWGPVLGVGGRYDSGRMAFLLEGRVYRGIPTLLPPEFAADLQNGVFSLYAGLEFTGLP